MKMLKRYVLGIILGLYAMAAWASCTTQTFIINGQVTVCMTCCYPNGSCTTTCN